MCEYSVGPIFNKKLLKNEVCGSCEQCMGPTDMLKKDWKVKLCGYYSWTVHKQ